MASQNLDIVQGLEGEYAPETSNVQITKHDKQQGNSSGKGGGE